mmetsp:Transcript_43838/g.82212  ORF Transcript_43838/g.82212 Transcript_43838/m.82212 type:complete len:244 (-) Transcript_43838:33-764(-)
MPDYPEQCLPDWYNPDLGKNSPCPYGRKLPGDVTLPLAPNFLQIVAAVYSALPFIVAFYSFCRLCVFRGTREFSFFAFLCAIYIANDIALKQYLHMKRPEGSCNLSCGMPSTHSTISIGLLALIIYDAWCRRKASLTGPLTFFDVDYHRMVVLGRNSCTYFIMIWVLILLPCPFSRIVLLDHTWAQIAVGSAVGLFYAFLWSLLVRKLQERYSLVLNEKICGILTHNYPLPEVFLNSSPLLST